MGDSSLYGAGVLAVLHHACLFIPDPGGDWWEGIKGVDVGRHEGRCDSAPCMPNLSLTWVNAGSEALSCSSTLTLMLCNTKSMKKKIFIPSDLLYEEQVNLTCLTETWLEESDVFNLVQLAPAGYKVLHQPQTGGMVGAG